MTTLLISIVFLLVVILAQLGFMMWVMTKIRDDQMVIRAFIAKQVRDRRVELGAPVDDAGFYEWLQAHPDRPRKNDPPVQDAR